VLKGDTANLPLRDTVRRDRARLVGRRFRVEAKRKRDRKALLLMGMLYVGSVQIQPPDNRRYPTNPTSRSRAHTLSSRVWKATTMPKHHREMTRTRRATHRNAPYSVTSRCHRAWWR
jgi:hypothetical protein